MADDYDFDDSEFMDYDDGWMYVEDEYGLADELAESAVAEPGYAGTNNELEMEEYEYDLYNYWDDVEYADDAYYEGPLYKTSPSTTAEKVGSKRKRAAAQAQAPSKRRRASGLRHEVKVEELDETYGQMENVVYISASERYRMAMAHPAPTKSKKLSAFLPDWRERFAGMDGIIHIVKEPKEMKRAAEADEETPEKVRHVDMKELAEGEDEDEGDWEDEDAEDAEDEEEGGGLALDPEMLKQILKQRLGEAGLEGMDEEAFMASIAKMLNGEAADDDATAELANMLLGRAGAEGGDAAVEGFLSQQGVRLEEDEGEADDEKADSGVYIPSDGPEPAQTTKQIAMHGGSPERGKKREKKRKSVRFDVEADEEKQSADAHQAEQTEAVLPAPPSSEDTAIAETAKSKAANTTAVRTNRRKPAVPNRVAPTPDDQLQEELQDEAQGVEGAAKEEVGKQTRKRKAEEDGEQQPVMNGRVAKEAATRKTRSARASGQGGK